MEVTRTEIAERHFVSILGNPYFHIYKWPRETEHQLEQVRVTVDNLVNGRPRVVIP